MKRWTRCLACAMALLLLLLASGCSVSPGEVPEPESTTQQTTRLPNASDSPVDSLLSAFPAWTASDETAGYFLSVEGAIVDCSEQEYSYAEMVEDLRLLKQRHPARFDYRSFGSSAAGRDLYVATLGNPNADKQFVVSAGIHGREYLTPLLVMKQVEFYLEYYDIGDYNGFRYAELFDTYCFYIVPMTNPDGIMLSQEGLSAVSDATLRQRIMEAFYRDRQEGYTQQTAMDEYLKTWKANANAVDLNRNFDALWKSVNTGIYRPSHKNYKGSSAASEPETKAMMKLISALSDVQAVLCIHSQGEVLYWDCGQTGSLRDRTQDFTEAIALENRYRVIYEQNNDASLSDWCALEQGLIAVTVETGVDSCPLPISQFPKIWSDNFDLFAFSAAHFSVGA